MNLTTKVVMKLHSFLSVTILAALIGCNMTKTQYGEIVLNLEDSMPSSLDSTDYWTVKLQTENSFLLQAPFPDHHLFVINEKPGIVISDQFHSRFYKVGSIIEAYWFEDEKTFITINWNDSFDLPEIKFSKSKELTPIKTFFPKTADSVVIQDVKDIQYSAEYRQGKLVYLNVKIE
jgi:hypothetical protein